MEVLPVFVEKEIHFDDDIVDLILGSRTLFDGDIVVIAQKIISKQEGRLVDLSSVTPSLLATGISSQYQKDPRIVELILRESKKIVRMERGILVVESNSGFVCANAGIDESNVKNGHATLLPINPDASAASIRKTIFDRTKKNVAVIVSDTFGRPFRNGQTNFAIGVSGIKPILDYSGTLDSFDRTLRVTAIAIVDEICAAAELVMKKSARCPIAVVRYYDFQNEPSFIASLIRPENEDLFR